MEFLYKWTQNLSFYMIIVTVVLQMVPSEEYRKYVRFFIGFVLVLMLTQPIMTLFQMKGEFEEFYRDAKQKQEQLEREWNDG